MKKLLSVLLALVMILVLASCAKKEPAAPAEPAPAAPAADDAAEDAEETQTTTFTMGIDAEYPPFSFMGDDGEYTGFDVEICKAACEKLGWNFEVFGVNWDEKLIQLDAGECDCVWSGMTLLDSMSEAGYVLSAPYYNNNQVLLVKEDSDFNDGADLEGFVVAVQLGTSGEALLNNELTDWAATFDSITTCESFLKCFAELGGDAVDAVFVDYPVAKSYAEENEGYRIVDTYPGSDEFTEQYGIAFRADDQDLCDAIEGAVAELVEDGTYAEIAEKYEDVKPGLIFLG